MADQFLTREVSRRDFNAASLTALFVGMTVWVGACGSDGGSNNSVTAPTPTPTGASADKTASVGTNHGHVATVTSAQLQAGGAAMLNIQGTSAHGHTVDLSAGEVGQIAGGTRVTKNSSTDSGHNHSVTFN